MDGDPNLQRFEPGAVVRACNAWALSHAWDTVTEAGCTLLTPGPKAAPERFRSLVREVVAAHALLSHPHIPTVLCSDAEGERPFVAFACGAVCDGLTLLEHMGRGSLLPYEAADAFIATLREAMQCWHALPDPTTGAPRALGWLSLANVLFDVEGRWYIVGFGRNFPLEDEAGRRDGSVVTFYAPELSAGASPTPIGDFIALRLLMRTLLSFVEPPPALARVLRGEVDASGESLVPALLWFETEVMNQLPPLRPTMAEILRRGDEVRRLLGVTPSRARFSAYVAGLLLQREPPPAPPPTLMLTEDCGSATLPDGRVCHLSGAARRITKALAAAHGRGPSATLSVWDVIEAGWPDEKLKPEAAMNRAYVTVNRLRSAGLGAWIERTERGYRLAPSLMLSLG